MKPTLFKLIVFLGFYNILFLSCNKQCIFEVKCQEKPLNNQTTCTAYFESWIYYPEENKCKYIGYSGCSAIGFETKADCEKCDCKD